MNSRTESDGEATRKSRQKAKTATMAKPCTQRGCGDGKDAPERRPRLQAHGHEGKHHDAFTDS